MYKRQDHYYAAPPGTAPAATATLVREEAGGQSEPDVVSEHTHIMNEAVMDTDTRTREQVTNKALAGDDGDEVAEDER